MVYVSHSLKTARLELIPATLPMLEADRDDRGVLGLLLDAGIPGSWPPELVDDGTLADFIRMKKDASDPHFCSWYWILEDHVGMTRTLIGSGGTASCPGIPDAVMIGYSVLGDFRNRGYATEAIRRLVPVILSWPGIRRIIATTYPDLKASIRVLEKSGFVPAGGRETGQGMEEGTVMYVLEAHDSGVPGRT